MMRYEDIRKELEQAPATWCPGLLKALTETTVNKKVFLPGGAARFVQKVEDNVLSPKPQEEV